MADAAADGVEAVGGGVTIGLDHTDNAAPALDISGLVEMRIEEVVKVNKKMFEMNQVQRLIGIISRWPRRALW